MSTQSGLSQAFLGLIILPIAGNACEHITAVLVAYKNKMDLAIGVALGSSIQIAIFVLPVLVLIGYAFRAMPAMQSVQLLHVLCLHACGAVLAMPWGLCLPCLGTVHTITSLQLLFGSDSHDTSCLVCWLRSGSQKHAPHMHSA